MNLKYENCCPKKSFFLKDTATTEIYTLSLHDALPILETSRPGPSCGSVPRRNAPARAPAGCGGDRKSTRLNSSHWRISYAVFCLKIWKTGSRIREFDLFSVAGRQWWACVRI